MEKAGPNTQQFATSCSIEIIWFVAFFFAPLVLIKACFWSKMSKCIQMVRQVQLLNHLNTEQPYCPVFRCWYSDGYWSGYLGARYSNGGFKQETGFEFSFLHFAGLLPGHQLVRARDLNLEVFLGRNPDLDHQARPGPEVPARLDRNLEVSLGLVQDRVLQELWPSRDPHRPLRNLDQSRARDLRAVPSRGIVFC